MAFRRAVSKIICSSPQNLLNSSRPISQSALQTNYNLSETIIQAPGNREEENNGGGVMSLKEVPRASEMETTRSRLRAMSQRQSCITRSDFLNICAGVSAVDGGSEIARRLDCSGDVIVLGNVVYLRPDQVAKTIVLPILMNHNKNDSQIKEFKQMEERRNEIDRKVEAQVKMELWCGLGFLTLQTVGLARLTFWELSWDVMEPICFFLTSTYFMAGYGFFLWTSREPSFEGLFASRFASKQKRLMEDYGFDLRKFNELKNASPQTGSACSEKVDNFSSSHCDCHNSTFVS